MALSLWLVALVEAAVSGRVLERGTSDPVAGAVLLVGDQEIPVGEDGRFTVDLPPGTAVTVRAPGYAEDVVTVPAEGELRVLLRRTSGALEVVVEARRDTPSVAEQRLDQERVQLTPGTFEDPVRLVQSLPGVTQTPEYSPIAGDIAVRGSVPSDNRFYLDGIELPYLYHYNQYASGFHTRLLDELTLYPSTFGAPWGDATGAILETRSVWDDPERLRGSVNWNAIMTGAEVATPLAPGWSMRASGRRSFLDLFERDAQQYTLFPIFDDWFGRLEHETAGGQRWALVTIGAGDAYDRYAGEPTVLDPYEQSQNPVFAYRQRFAVVGLQHDRAGLAGSLRGSLSYTWHGLSGELPDAASRRRRDVVALREDATLRLTDDLYLATGGELRVEAVDLAVETNRAWPEVAEESPLLARGVEGSEQAVIPRLGIYVEPRWELGPVRLTPGVRADADLDLGAVVVDPRLGVRLALGEDRRLRLAGGLYHQFPSPDDRSAVFGDPTLGPSRSWQAAVGVDQAIAGRLELQLDGWVKRMADLVQAETGAAPVGGVEGSAWGVSFTSRYRLRDRFFTWASVDLARSWRTVDGVTSPSDYDQPFATSLVASWTFAPTWNVGVRWRMSAGLPYTPVTDGIYQAASDTYLPVYGVTNGARFPVYQKYDAHLEKKFILRRVTLTPYLEAWYVPRSANVMYYAWRYDYDEVTEVRGPGFIPLFGIRGEG